MEEARRGQGEVCKRKETGCAKAHRPEYDALGRRWTPERLKSRVQDKQVGGVGTRINQGPVLQRTGA